MTANAADEQAGKRGRRGGRRQRTAEELKSKGCTPEVTELILAVQELINTRYGSQREFLDSLPARSNDHTMAATTLSNQLSGTGRWSTGPTWKTVHVVVTHCAAPGMRLAEMARLAGLWARANDVPRPDGYRGPVFPATPWSEEIEEGGTVDVIKLSKGMYEGLQPYFPVDRVCPRRSRAGIFARSVRRLVFAALVIGVSGILLNWSIRYLGVIASLLFIAIAFWAPISRGIKLRRHELEQATEPNELGHDLILTIEEPVPPPEGYTEKPNPQWDLPPQATVSTRFEPAGLKNWLHLLVRHWGQTQVGATCLGGYLTLDYEKDPTCEWLALVEWSISDHADNLMATGFLHPEGATCVIPSDGTWRRSDGNYIDLEGVTFPQEVQDVTIVLRRLGNNCTCPCRVTWTLPSLHLHPVAPRTM